MESNFKPRCEFISSSSLENESGPSKSLTADAAAGVAGRSAGYDDGVCFWNRPHMILMIEIREFSWHIYVICTRTHRLF